MQANGQVDPAAERWLPWTSDDIPNPDSSAEALAMLHVAGTLERAGYTRAQIAMILAYGITDEMIAAVIYDPDALGRQPGAATGAEGSGLAEIVRELLGPPRILSKPPGNCSGG